MKPILFAVLSAACVSAWAQAHQPPSDHQPYRSHAASEIKALTDDEVKQYLNGAGMGYAKPAELNHVPGPMHALELSEPLGLSADQHRAISALMHEHKAEARAIGAKLVESERALEMLFRRPAVDREVLAEAVAKAAQLQGRYRLSHLDTHLRTRALLSDEQVAKYDRLRGY